MPRRLQGSRRSAPLAPPYAADEWPGFRVHGSVLRRLRAVRRSLVLLLLTLAAIPVQTVLMLLPGCAKIRFARTYWRLFCAAFGLKVRVVGTSARPVPNAGRPVVYVSNHSSWLDIAVLGSRLYTCFVSKDDVADWPVVNTIARLGRTIFVSRNRGSTGRERDEMIARLAAGDSLVLFPEGTTSDGSRVLPFRTSFLAVAEGDTPPLVQPVSVVYDRLAGLPAGRATRPLFAYYGDMTIGPHFWHLVHWKGMRATLLLHPPLDPRDFPDRKALTAAAYEAVANGAALLRQNRLAKSIQQAA